MITVYVSIYLCILDCERFNRATITCFHLHYQLLSWLRFRCVKWNSRARFLRRKNIAFASDDKSKSCSILLRIRNMIINKTIIVVIANRTHAHTPHTSHTTHCVHTTAHTWRNYIACIHKSIKEYTFYFIFFSHSDFKHNYLSAAIDNGLGQSIRHRAIIIINLISWNCVCDDFFATLSPYRIFVEWFSVFRFSLFTFLFAFA